jgi:hypothetical protein
LHKSNSCLFQEQNLKPKINRHIKKKGKTLTKSRPIKAGPSHHSSILWRCNMTCQIITCKCIERCTCTWKIVTYTSIPEYENKYDKIQWNCLNRTLNKPNSSINQALNKVLKQEFFVNCYWCNCWPSLLSILLINTKSTDT